MKLVRQCANWKLFFSKGKSYEIHRRVASVWSLYNEITADNDEQAIYKTIAVATMVDRSCDAFFAWTFLRS